MNRNYYKQKLKFLYFERKLRILDIEKIVEHYNNNYSLKVFNTKLSHGSVSYYLMYVYNYVLEFENFSKTFLSYLPFYVRNHDQLITLDETKNLDEQLFNRSKSIWKDSEIIPKRKTKMNGVYGELFLDYYMRIIKEKKPFITYANKRAFASKQESKGIDNVLYYIENNEINICFCEAKFVAGASNAKNELIHDIEGDEEHLGHVTKEYLNRYLFFIVEKGTNIDENDKELFEPFIKELNKELDAGNDFVSIIINENICVNFVFFAIFDSKQRKPENIESYYQEIFTKCENHITSIGFSNYKIEIVFIPTESKPIEIKKEIDKEYE